MGDVRMEREMDRKMRGNVVLCLEEKKVDRWGGEIV